MTSPTRAGRGPSGIFNRSPAGVFGRAPIELEVARTTDVDMTWSVEWVEYDNAAKVKTKTQAGAVQLNDRYYQTALWLMGAASGRGGCTVDPINIQPFDSGTIDEENDTHTSNALNLNPFIGPTAVGFAWNGWQDLSSDGGKPSFIDTGTTMEFYGRTNLRVVFGSPLSEYTLGEGLYCYDPNVREPFTDADDWIMHYFTGGGGLKVQVGGTLIECRVKVVITV